MLQNAYLDVKIGVDTDENEVLPPPKEAKHAGTGRSPSAWGCSTAGSASSSWQRRPCGPSATLTDSRPSRGMPLSCQKLRPEHSDAACGDSVIVSEAACGACDSDARTYVQYPPPTPPRPPRLRRLRYATQEAGTRELLRTVHKGPSLRTYMSTQRGVLHRPLRSDRRSPGWLKHRDPRGKAHRGAP